MRAIDEFDHLVPIAGSADDLEDRQWVGRIIGGPSVGSATTETDS